MELMEISMERVERIVGKQTIQLELLQDRVAELTAQLAEQQHAVPRGIVVPDQPEAA